MLRILSCATALILLVSCGGSDNPAAIARRQSPFALGVVSSFNPRDLDFLATLGNPNGGARITFYWNMIEPLLGVWDFSFYDDLVPQAKAANIPLVGILAYSVKWASPTDPNAVSASSISYYPPNPSDFITYVKTVVSRYPSVHSWEVWNEPNGPRFWLPQPNVAQYSQLLQESSRAIKDIDAQSVVILGGLAPGDPGGSSATSVSAEDFLVGIYLNGGGPYFEVVGFHPYNQGVSPDQYLESDITNLYDTMAAQGDGNKKILVSELGWFAGTAPGAVSEATQADYLTRAFSILYRLEFVGGFYWYHLKDHTPVPQPAVPDLNYGLFRWDGSPRPAATSFRDLAKP